VAVVVPSLASLRAASAKLLLRTFAVGILAVVSLATPYAADAQQAGKAYQIGKLVPGSPIPHLEAAFEQGLRDLGYVVGQNIAIQNRFARGDIKRLHEFAADLVRTKVDVIFAAGDEAIDAARQATSTIPVVMLACDALEAGFVPNLRRPGGNLTGITCISGDLAGKRLELLREVAPRFARLAVLYNPGDPHGILEIRKTQVVAPAWGVKGRTFEARVQTELPRRFQTIAQERADALYVVGDNFTLTHAKQIVELATTARLPGVYAYREFADAGGLIAYGPNIADMLRRLSTYIDRILKGGNPGDLPVEQPTKFDLVINVKTAKALGRTIPSSLLSRANETHPVKHGTV
jgi:putative ABC transport system substrate-binding protein